MWDTSKHTNICVMGPAKGEKAEKGAEKYLKK